MAKGCGYSNAGTAEFLVKGQLSDPEAKICFLEVNPRCSALLLCCCCAASVVAALVCLNRLVNSGPISAVVELLVLCSIQVEHTITEEITGIDIVQVPYVTL